MPQPREVTRLADDLVDVFRTADQSIEAELARLAGDPTNFRRTARLQELKRSVDRHMRAVETSTRSWLQGTLPEIYALGADVPTTVLATEFAWTSLHTQAVQQIASSTFDQVLAATRFVRNDVKQFLRSEGRKQTVLSLIEGRTAKQAGAQLAKAAAGEKIAAVRYADGSSRTIGDYGDMLLRTITADAYNQGTVNQSTELGVEWFEVLDGAECGWSEHDDPDLADGMIVSADDAAANSISHPRCQRSFIPRVDLSSAAEAMDAERLADAASRADNHAEQLRREGKAA